MLLLLLVLLLLFLLMSLLLLLLLPPLDALAASDLAAVVPAYVLALAAPAAAT